MLSIITQETKQEVEKILTGRGATIIKWRDGLISVVVRGGRGDTIHYPFFTNNAQLNSDLVELAKTAKLDGTTEKAIRSYW